MNQRVVTILLSSKIKLPKFVWFKIIYITGYKFHFGFQLVYNEPPEKILQECCLNGNVELANFILSKRKKKVNGIFINGCMGGHKNIVKLFCEKGATNLHSGFFEACRLGHVEVIKYLIEQNKNLVTAHCLYIACKYANIETIKLLTAVTAPQMQKAYRQSLKVKKYENAMYFLKNHKDIFRNCSTANAFESTCRHGNVDLVRSYILLDDFWTVQGFNIACANNKLDIVIYMLRKNKIKKNVDEGFKFACSFLCKEVVEYFFNHVKFDPKMGLKILQKKFII